MASSSLLSFFVLYPFVHECGHLIPAIAGGATVNDFVWTPFFGHAHVGLSNVSGSALPWVDAGGALLPTLVGTALVGTWMALPTKASGPNWRLWLLVPGVVMLVGNLGLFFEATVGSGSYRHMYLLAKAIGGEGIVGKALEVLPAVWTVVVVALAIGLHRRQSKATEPSGERANWKWSGNERG
ncbi:MAG: hypothetical protein KDB03_20310, partial [Planctomycetales bacterium]|nr:hypothetical protein [Planctomycetales bacterium]